MIKPLNTFLMQKNPVLVVLVKNLKWLSRACSRMLWGLNKRSEKGDERKINTVVFTSYSPLCFLKWCSFTAGCENEGYLKACACVWVCVFSGVRTSRPIWITHKYHRIITEKKVECGPPVLHCVQEIDSDA